MIHLANLGFPLKFKRGDGPKSGPWTFTKPSVQATLHFKTPKGDKGVWNFAASSDVVDDAYVISSTRPTVYKIPAQNLVTFRSGVEIFRNGKKAFEFPIEQARQIEIYPEGKLQKFVKTGSDWKFEGGSEVQSDKLVAVVQNIHELEARDFLPQAKAKGFKPEQRLVVRDEKGGVLLDLTWGDTFPSTGRFNKGMTFRFVKTNLEKDAMSVEAGAINHLLAALAPKKSDVEKAGKK